MKSRATDHHCHQRHRKEFLLQNVSFFDKIIIKNILYYILLFNASACSFYAKKKTIDKLVTLEDERSDQLPLLLMSIATGKGSSTCK